MTKYEMDEYRDVLVKTKYCLKINLGILKNAGLLHMLQPYKWMLRSGPVPR